MTKWRIVARHVKAKALAALVYMSLLAPFPSNAGQACEDQKPSPTAVRNAFELAHATYISLEKSGAQVAVIARSGQDLSKYGLSWSHTGLIWRDHPAGKWITVHLLNDCGTATSKLYNEGLANFFSDSPLRWDAMVLIPGEATQTQLATALRGRLPSQMHEPAYNMVAYPFSTKYQNSNQWVLELMAIAMSGKPDTVSNPRPAAQTWLRENGFTPSSLTIPAMTRLGGRMFKANVAFDDHPSAQRWADRIDTVSVESIESFLLKRGAKRLTISLPK